MIQFIQVVGALLLLAGFVAVQRGALRNTSPLYLVVNAAGAAVLAGVALIGQDWGFLVLEGTWAGVSAVALGRAHRGSRSTRPQPRPQPRPTMNARGVSVAPVPASLSLRCPQWRRLLPPTRVVRLAGDELTEPARLIHLFGDSYAGAQGRQWLQAHILWWILTFLRGNGIRADSDTLASPALASAVTAMGLPAGHAEVRPADQAAMNFGLWWPILTDLARTVYRPWWRRLRPGRGRLLPDVAQLEERARRLGLWPWMSSASFEEMSGIGGALATTDDHERRRRFDANELMVRILLPELLVVELHWLHAPQGRPRTGGRTPVEVVLLRQYHDACTKWTRGRYLTPLDHMYLRAGDILDHLSSLPEQSRDPVVQRIVELHREIRHALNRTDPPGDSVEPESAGPLVSGVAHRSGRPGWPFGSCHRRPLNQ